VLGKFRLVLPGNPQVQVRSVKKPDFDEIEKTLRDEKILGIIVSKE